MNRQKIKTSYSLTKECIELLENNKNIDGSRSKNELVENAIRFYIAHHTATRDVDFLTRKFTAASVDAAKETENRLARIAYKIAVECATLNLMMVDFMRVSKDEATQYRGKAVKILEQTHGFLTLDQAQRFRAEEIRQGIAQIYEPYGDDYSDYYEE